jgi:hypothetical protein
MKKRSGWRVVACLFTTLFFLCACRKSLEHLPPDLQGTVPCKIAKINFFFPEQNFPDSMTFTYNALGNPVTGLRGFVDDGSPNFTFYYDSHNRLIDFFQTLQNEAIETWDKYVYLDDRTETPYLDSSFLFPDSSLNGFPVHYFNLTNTWFEYDPERRIIQTRVFDVTLFIIDTTTNNYAYDRNGNLEGGAYDNKVNFLRTSSIFEFLDANYSQNNSLSLGTNFKYNEFGLPTQFDANGTVTILTIPMSGQIRITYDCTCGVGANSPLTHP